MNEWQILSQLPQETWARILLQQDPIYPKIPTADVEYYIRQGLQAGLDAASQWNLSQIYQAIENQQVRLCTKHSEGPCGIHAEYRSVQGSSSSDREIRLYEQTLQEIRSAAELYKIPLHMQQIRDLHLAHEFYHYLEDTHQVDVSQTNRFVSFMVFHLFRQTRAIKSLHEIAAHTFAQHLCQTTYHPLQLDWLLLKQQDEGQAKVFFDTCLSSVGIEKR